MNPNGQNNNPPPAPVPESQTPQVIQGQTPQQTPVRSLKNKLILLVAAMLFVITVALLGYFLTHQDHYTFTINGTSVPEKDYKDIYSYYRNNEFKNADNTTALNLVKQLYIKNYVYKKNYLDATHTQASLKEDTIAYTYPTSLSNAPEALRTITAENNLMEPMLIKKLGVKVRSGYIFTLQLTQNVGEVQQQLLEKNMNQILSSYATLLNRGTTFEKVKSQFLDDPKIKSQELLSANASSFTQMPASHPFMPGSDFLDDMFNTPMGTSSAVFKAASGNTVILGIIYPTSPQIKGNYIDLQQWLNAQEKKVQVTTDFSDFK